MLDKKLKQYYQHQPEVPSDFSKKVSDILIAKHQNKSLKFSLKLTYSFSLIIFLIGFYFLLNFLFMNNNFITKKIVFQAPANRPVMIMGDFNNWTAKKMEFHDGKWEIEVTIKPNIFYKYSFMMNGKVVQDSKNLLPSKDYFGNSSSTLIVFNKN